ncbi:MAG: NADAR family protein [Bacteroidota bacterium]
MSLPSPSPQPVQIDGTDYTLVAFYYPGRNTAWDDIYNVPYFGNFWITPVTLTPPGLPTGSFHTAEAAFQATKWWQDASIRKKFEAAPNGDRAFYTRNHAGPQTNHDWAGFGRDGAMDAVLASKFADADLAAALRATGDAYLLEHNSHTGRDSYWSDNCDGTGSNHLGLALMRLRATLGGSPFDPSAYPSPGDFTPHVQGATACR